ncbi:MAG: FAD-dependent monooxygenase [Pyrinomonadaceae bacterium]|nr:FAD-dependent monooxygenase [Pyrinomonadaceae bacterium]
MTNGIQKGIVVGGGIGGLCTAIALRQIGVETVVYEQTERLSQAGAGLTLWANAIKGLRKLGIADAVIEAGAKIERGEIRTAGGRTLSRSQPGELEGLFGEPTVAIHRADLHDILLSALAANTLRLGAKCVRVEQEQEGVVVGLTGGRSERADLVIGADGVHSMVRQQLFPDVRLRYSGYTAWRGVVATKDESALGLTSESWGRGSRFGIMRINKARVYWFATANAPAGRMQTAAERKSFLQERFVGWHHPVEHLIEATPAEEILHSDIHDLKPLKRWSEGRVVLLGDAAHPTTPNMGQGACMAIESSLVLARCLSRESNLADALKCYEAERMPRTRWITEQSWKIGRVGQLENPLLRAARDFLIRVTPAKLVRRTLEKAAGYEL